ncbi:MAG: AMP-binding protein [Thermodesulfobacteriota bacterium]
MTFTTLNHLLDQSCRKFADRPALSLAFESPLSFKQLQSKVVKLAAVLHHEGIKKKDKVAILAENSPNWAAAYFAITRLGAIAVPILPDFPHADVRHVLSESKCKIIFTSQRQIEKTYELERGNLKTIVTLDDSLDPSASHNVEPLTIFLEREEQLLAKIMPKVEKLAQAVSADDLASVIYTSGTSGHSKAVMLSHGNFCANVTSGNKVLTTATPEWTFLSILPVSHTYEFTVGLLIPMSQGCRVVYAGKPPTPTFLERICKKEQPEVMCVVPMVMEKIYKKRVLSALNAKKVLRLACKIGPVRRKIMKKIGDRLLAFFGGNLQLLAIGGAALNYEAEHFLREAGLPYMVGYGLTEASPLLSGGPIGGVEIPLGACGMPMPDVEIKIHEPNEKTGIGEIWAKGDNIMQGYEGNPDATKDTLKPGGWLATGDLGRLDGQGFLHIKGRSKSVIVLSSGENIYPETIEEKLNSAEWVAESLVVGNNNQLEAKIYLDHDIIARDTAKKTVKERLNYTHNLMADLRIEINAQLPTYSKIHHFTERQEPFIKTATHKIKRYLYTGS